MACRTVRTAHACAQCGSLALGCERQPWRQPPMHTEKANIENARTSSMTSRVCASRDYMQLRFVGESRHRSLEREATGEGWNKAARGGATTDHHLACISRTT